MKAFEDVYTKETHYLDVDDHRVKYVVYSRRDFEGAADKRLLLLHGAGVAGELTWEAIIYFLDAWSEILVPDFRGAGETVHQHGHEAEFTLTELANDVMTLVDHLGWHTLDLGGYSMGGLVSMLFKVNWPGQVESQFLLESAGLEREDYDESLALRRRYQGAVSALGGEAVEQGVTEFLDIIAPKRRVSAAVEKVTIERLAHRPLGFANALNAVTAAFNALDRDALIAGQERVVSFVGGNSVEPLHAYQSILTESHPSWQYQSVAGTDHSLPYQKPRQIAQSMNKAVIAAQ